jgi:Group 4 capsule polysaccharide lipoprotein gfcB, YjbF
MRRMRVLFIVVVSAMLAALPVGSVGVAQEYEYVPVPVGTRLIYDNFQCTVTSVAGFESACSVSGDKGGSLSLFGQLVSYGAIPKASFHAVLFGYYTKPTEILTITLDEANKSKLRSLWPVGMTSSASYELELRWKNSTVVQREHFDSTIRVTGRDKLMVGGTPHEALIIEETAEGTRRSAFVRTWWLDPTIGVVLKGRVEWTASQSRGLSAESVLTSIEWPPGQAPAQAASP